MARALSGQWLRLSEGLPGPFWALVAGVFVTRAGTFILPLLFVYLTQERQLSLSVAGVVTSLYGLGSLGGSLLGGHLADHLGRRATMLGSLLLGAVCMVLLGLSTELYQLAAMTFLTGLTGDAFRPASQAMVADVVAPAHRMKAFAILYWAVNLGFSLAAVIGGFMARRHFLALFIADACTTLLLAAIIHRLVPETRPPARSGEKSGWLTPFVDRPYAVFLFLQFLTVLVFFQHLSGLPEDMRQKGLSTEEFGLAVASNGVLIVLFQPLVTRLLTGFQRGRLLAASGLLTGLGFALTALATSLAGYLATVAIWTLAEIIFSPVNASIVADMSPAEHRGRYQGAYSLTWSGGAMVAPLIGPAVVERAGLPVFWALCGAVGVVVAAGHLLFTARSAAGQTPRAT